MRLGASVHGIALWIAHSIYRPYFLHLVHSHLVTVTGRGAGSGYYLSKARLSW